MTATMEPTTVYDSRHDTWTHIHEVQRGLNVIMKTGEHIRDDLEPCFGGKT